MFKRLLLSCLLLFAFAVPMCGFGTSPSFADVPDAGPVVESVASVVEAGASHAPTTPKWLIQSAAWVLAALVALRKMRPALFDKDGVGFALSVGASFLYVVCEGVSRGEMPSLATFGTAFTMAVLASGGYSVVWKRAAKPLLIKAGRWAGFKLEGYGTSPSKP